MTGTARAARFDADGNGRMDIVILNSDMPCVRSLHKELEIAYIRTGGLWVMIDDERVPIRAGETLVISGFTIHEFITPASEVQAVRVKLWPEWLEAPFWSLAEKKRLRDLLSRPFVIGEDERVSRLFAEATEAMDGEQLQYRCLNKMMEMAALLLEDRRLVSRCCASGGKAAGGMSDALEFLHTHCHEDISLGQLARHVGMSESYCSKVFHQMMGVTFTDFVNTLRVSDARYLLGNTDHSVIEIADEVGFSSIQTFNRVFRKNCGQTPSEYRAQMRAYRARA